MRRFFRKRLPAFLLTLVMVMTMVPAVSAKSSADIEYEVDAGEVVNFDISKFTDYYDENRDDNLSYLRFTSASGLDSCGQLYAYDYSRDEVTLDEDDLGSAYFYVSRSDMSRGDYRLNGMNFLAGKRSNGETVDLTFQMRGDNGGKLTGILRIVIGKTSGSSKGDITYTVKPGEEVVFSDEDFSNAYDNAGGSGTMKYVVFEKPSSDYSDAGTIYSRYGKRNATSFTRSELDDYKFYYGDSDYGDYDLDELSFVADKSFSDSIEIAFTAYGGRGSKENDSVSGTLKITSSKSASSSKGDITYTVKAGEEVTFDDDDFEKIYENSSCTGSFK